MELLNKVAEESKTKLLYTYSMDQITIKTPNPTGSLFLKIDLKRDLAAGVYCICLRPPPLLGFCLRW